MTRTIVLHQITALDVEPLEFLEIAAGAGCGTVSLFSCLPTALVAALKGHLHLPPAVTAGTKQEVLDALADYSLTVDGVEFFPITQEVDFEEYKRGLALGRELGANRAVTHVIDTDRSRAVDRLGRVTEMAKAEGLKLGIEFTPTTPGCKTIQEGAWFIDQVGSPNLGMGVDALHLVRGGGTAADVAKLDARYFTNGQLCDGHGLHATSSYMEEVHNREKPGKGDFPLKAIFDALPATLPLEIEVPFQKWREAGVTVAGHVRDAVACTRKVVDTLVTTR